MLLQDTIRHVPQLVSGWGSNTKQGRPWARTAGFGASSSPRHLTNRIAAKAQGITLEPAAPQPRHAASRSTLNNYTIPCYFLEDCDGTGRLRHPRSPARPPTLPSQRGSATLHSRSAPPCSKGQPTQIILPACRSYGSPCQPFQLASDAVQEMKQVTTKVISSRHPPAGCRREAEDGF